MLQTVRAVRVKSRIEATYRVRGTTQAIAVRAEAIAVEQSVEMPVDIIADHYVRDDIIGRVEGITAVDDGLFDVRISLSSDTVGEDPGQLLNMLFGNSSLHDDVVLSDAELPAHLVDLFGGPRHGLAGLRSRVGAGQRALTCSALKPQGLAAEALGDLAYRLAMGKLDYIKDDHGLADQRSSPFAARVMACAEAVQRATDKTGHPTRYVPSFSGHLDMMRRQAEQSIAAGVDTIMIAPMLAGLSNCLQLAREFPELAMLAHPTMAGAARIAPVFLLGKLFRLIGADGVIFPNHGGRFGYSPELCRSLADTALGDWRRVKAAVPVPAGGMVLDRVPEMLKFYGPDVMLLIGGGLLSAGDRLTEATAEFTQAVREYGHG